ncbi:MAG: Folate transporter 3 [Nitrospira sp.]|nr:MAG: Folate transporter 3 [Nitrospira sp.]
MANSLLAWIDRNILSLGRDMRLSYLPPLMVYMAYGISGLTGIVGTFFVKDYLGLSASFLAALGFWAGIPWALKMPIGHAVDLLWRWKSWLVGVGAGLLAVSLGIMAALIGQREAMTAVLSAEVWFVLSALLAPIGYVIQDAVADAMTVEAVPRVDERGQPFDEPTRKLMHTTMQTLGRVAIVGGGILVAMINVYVFSGTEGLPQAELVRLYKQVYLMALVIPFVSVLGVGVAWLLQRRQKAALIQQGFSREQVEQMVDARGDGSEATTPDWWVLGGSLIFALFTVTVGLGGFSYSEEIVFAGSMGIVLFLMAKLMRELEPDKRFTLVGTAVVIFIFRAIPGAGPGATWWMIDDLKFDQQFLSILSLIGGTLTLAGMFIFRRFMAERSIAYVVGFLTVVGTVLTLPVVSMYYGLHEWTARMTGGIVDARFIALIDTALESPLGQISMIPMLAWIANSAPANLKATFFAVMASFTNLALSLSQLGTKYLNDLYVVTREVKDAATGAIQSPADYSQLGSLLVAQLLLGLALPLAAIVFAKVTRFKSA